MADRIEELLTDTRHHSCHSAWKLEDALRHWTWAIKKGLVTAEEAEDRAPREVARYLRRLREGS